MFSGRLAVPGNWVFLAVGGAQSVRVFSLHQTSGDPVAQGLRALQPSG